MIRTDPGYTLYGNDCNHRYTPGLTPKLLYISLTDIVVNPWPPVGLPDAPNVIVVLEQDPIFACHWSKIISPYQFDFWTESGSSLLQILVSGFTRAFFGFGNATTQYISNINTGSHDYMGGSAYITTRESDINQPTIQGVMALLNIAPAKKTFAEIFPIDADNSIYKFNRRIDKTNILVQIDHSKF